MSASSQPLLYSFWRSSCAWRVRIALNLKGIEYDVKAVGLKVMGGDGHTDDFRAVNPLEKVPALHIDGHTLIESIAIMHYLEETRPQPPLLPQDPYNRCKVREICETIVSGIQPLQNMAVLERIGDEKKSMDWAQHFIKRGLDGIEKLLTMSAGKYCVGDNISMADCCLVPQVFNAEKYFGVDLSPYPIISRIYHELENHPAIRATQPSTQIGYPSKAIE